MELIFSICSLFLLLLNILLLPIISIPFQIVFFFVVANVVNGGNVMQLREAKSTKKIASLTELCQGEFCIVVFGTTISQMALFAARKENIE